ncbi:MAG: LA_3659 family protein [Brevinema sp.]
MEFIIPIVSLLIFSGLLFYFRWTDAKNADIRQLQSYIRNIEQHIDQYFRQRKKEFEDKIIPAEVAIDRMNKLAGTLQQKVNDFNQTLDEGEKIFYDLRQEMGDISSSLTDYQKMRSEFEDIEQKIGQMLAMKDLVMEGSQDLDKLRNDMKSLKDEYDTMISSLTNKSKSELETFFNNMNSTLNSHLEHAQSELQKTNTNIQDRIEELNSSAETMNAEMGIFRSESEEGLESLKKSFHDEITVLRGMAEVNAQEIIDRWVELKEKSDRQRMDIEDNIIQQQGFFAEEKASVQDEIQKIQSTLDSELMARVSQLVAHQETIDTELRNLEKSLRTHLELGLDEKIHAITQQLSQTQQAFAAQEAEITKSLDSITQNADTRISTAEKVFYDDLERLKDKVHNVTDNAEKILIVAEEKIDEKMKLFTNDMQGKVADNMNRLEESFRQENEDRMQGSIEEISKTLADKYTEEYKKNFASISEKADTLEEAINDKMANIPDLETTLQELRQSFNEEKDTILLMEQGLQENREKYLKEVQEYLEKTVEQIETSMQNTVDAYFTESISNQQLYHDQWAGNYDQTLKDAQTIYHSIKESVDKIALDLKNINENTMESLRLDSQEILQENARNLEDFKRESDSVNRDHKETFANQLESARKSVGELKQELWNQEQKVRDAAQKDFDRLTDRVKEYDRRFNDFLKKTEALDRLDSAAEKFQGRMQEFENLKKDLEHLSSELLNSQKIGQRTMSDVRAQNDVLEQNLASLGGYVDHAKTVQDQLQNSVGEMARIEEFLQQIAQEQEKADSVQDLLVQNLERYNELQEALDELESRKGKVDEMLLNIDSVNHMVSNTAEISKQIAELGNYAVDLQQQLGQIQHDLTTAIKEKEHLEATISSINDLEHLLEHVEQERKSVEKMKDFITKSSRLLKDAGGGAALSSSNEDHTSTIISLHKRGWNIDDIAKSLKIPPIVVETTLDKNQ